MVYVMGNFLKPLWMHITESKNGSIISLTRTALIQFYEFVIITVLWCLLTAITACMIGFTVILVVEADGVFLTIHACSRYHNDHPSFSSYQVRTSYATTYPLHMTTGTNHTYKCTDFCLMVTQLLHWVNADVTIPWRAAAALFVSRTTSPRLAGIDWSWSFSSKPWEVCKEAPCRL